MQAATELGIERVIHTSTSETYGTAQFVPINEKHPLVGQSPYSASKIGADQLSISYYRSFNLPVKIVRPFNTYGPRMRLNDGRALPTFIGQCLRGDNITVFGDGSQTRSFCYVDDLVEGVYKLLLSNYQYPVNIGNPSEISLKDFAKEILNLADSKTKIIYKPLPIDDPKQRRPDIKKAKAILDWTPKVDRKKGLKITYNYFKSLPKSELIKKPKVFISK